jgi:hypothetical protein
MTPELEQRYEALCRGADLGSELPRPSNNGQAPRTRDSERFQAAWNGLPPYIQAKIDTNAKSTREKQFEDDPVYTRRAYLNSKRNILKTLFDVWERDELSKSSSKPPERLRQVIHSETRTKTQRGL